MAIDTSVRDKGMLRQMQSLPLNAKVAMSIRRITEWYDYFNGDVCISFSGGKDSTVLAHLVHHLYPQVPMVFADTGLEYPEIREFARRMGAEFVRPKLRFDEVVSKYGYPIISKEVAEAIYYARRILNSEGGVERDGKRSSERTTSLLRGFIGTGEESHRRRTQIGNGQTKRQAIMPKKSGGGTTGTRATTERSRIWMCFDEQRTGVTRVTDKSTKWLRERITNHPVPNDGGEDSSPG